MRLLWQQPILYGGVVTHPKYLVRLLESGQVEGELCMHEHKLKKSFGRSSPTPPPL